jgi:hypothetical protein
MWSLLRLAGWRADDLINEADMLWVASRQAAPNFRPGDEYLYSNTGYALLALIIHRVSGKTLREFAHERIFEPPGMASTHVHDDHTEIVKGRTQAYEPRKGGGLRISIPVFDVAGTTSLFTTVEDMARWDDNFHHHKVGGAEIIQQMVTPGRLNDGGPMTYGFGLNIHSYRGLLIVEHSGADAGYRAHFLRFPKQRLAVVCLCNLSTMTPRTLALAVADTVLADQFPEPIYDETLESSTPDATLAGVYRNEDTGDLLRVTSTDEGLAVGFGHSQRLERLRGGTYRIEGQRLTRLRFAERDGRQTLVYGALYAPQPDPVFVRVAGPASVEPPLFDGGEFHSDEVDATYRLEPDGRVLRMTHYRLNEKTLQHAYDDVYASDELRIALERDGQGVVTGFRASTGRVRDVWFVRR